MAGIDNLVPLTTEKAREIGSKGGIASGKAKRRRKTLAEIGEMIGGLDVKSDANKKIMREAGIDDEDMINDVAMMFRLALKASSGNERAIELLSKLRGQFKEISQTEVSVKPLVDLTKRKKNGEKSTEA